VQVGATCLHWASAHYRAAEAPRRRALPADALAILRVNDALPHAAAVPPTGGKNAFRYIPAVPSFPQVVSPFGMGVVCSAFVTLCSALFLSFYLWRHSEFSWWVYSANMDSASLRFCWNCTCSAMEVLLLYYYKNTFVYLLLPGCGTGATWVFLCVNTFGWRSRRFP